MYFVVENGGRNVVNDRLQSQVAEHHEFDPSVSFHPRPFLPVTTNTVICMLDECALT